MISNFYYYYSLQVKAYDIHKRSHRSFDFLEIAMLSCQTLAESTRRKDSQLSSALFARSRLKWSELICICICEYYRIYANEMEDLISERKFNSRIFCGSN